MGARRVVVQSIDGRIHEVFAAAPPRPAKRPRALRRPRRGRQADPRALRADLAVAAFLDDEPLFRRDGLRRRLRARRAGCASTPPSSRRWPRCSPSTPRSASTRRPSTWCRRPRCPGPRAGHRQPARAFGCAPGSAPSASCYVADRQGRPDVRARRTSCSSRARPGARRGPRQRDAAARGPARPPLDARRDDADPAAARQRAARAPEAHRRAGHGARRRHFVGAARRPGRQARRPARHRPEPTRSVRGRAFPLAGSLAQRDDPRRARRASPTSPGASADRSRRGRGHRGRPGDDDPAARRGRRRGDAARSGATRTPRRSPTPRWTWPGVRQPGRDRARAGRRPGRCQDACCWSRSATGSPATSTTTSCSDCSRTGMSLQQAVTQLEGAGQERVSAR